MKGTLASKFQKLRATFYISHGCQKKSYKKTVGKNLLTVTKQNIVDVKKICDFWQFPKWYFK
jgi:hypothetical protein